MSPRRFSPIRSHGFPGRGVEQGQRPSAVQSGLSLVELLIALAVGILITLTASALLLQTQSAYRSQDEAAQVEATGRQALHAIAHMARQLAFTHEDAQCLSPCRLPDRGLLLGLDNTLLQGRAGMLPAASAPAVNGSDVLAIRVAGAGTGEHGDGTMVNCAGFGIPAKAASRSDHGRSDEAGWSIFHVSRDSAGVTQLVCRYRSANGWMTQPLASGIDSFQVLYGLDLNQDGMPERIVNATEIQGMNVLMHGSGFPMEEGGVWNNVVLVRIALLVSETSGRKPPQRPLIVHELFGQEYSEESAGDDPGVRLIEADLPIAEQRRMRKLFTMTLHLPRRQNGEAL